MLTKFSTEFGCICGDLVGAISSLCFRLLFLPSTLTGGDSGKITSSNSSGWRKVGHVHRNSSHLTKVISIIFRVILVYTQL